MKGTEQSSSSTYSLSKSPFTSPATPPLQVHEGDRQAVDEGHLEEWEGKVAQVIGKGGRRGEGIVPVCSLFLDIEGSGHIAVTGEDIRA